MYKSPYPDVDIPNISVTEFLFGSLTPEEQAANDQFLPCCSRSKSARLVLDL